MITLYSRRTARLLGAALLSAGALATAGALALPAGAQPASSGNRHTLVVRQIAFGERLHHAFQAGGKGAWHTEALTQPDDLSRLGGDIFAAFQNGVGAQGEPSTDGNLDSTLAEFTPHGTEVRQWDLRGKVDGLTADPDTGKVIATVNEDANSSLYTISPRTGHVTHYGYNVPLPHNGGTDAISIYHGQVFISASAPGTTGAAAPNAAYPAVYAVTLNSRTRTATVRPLYYDEAKARAVNGPHAGQVVRLGLTDPDSSEVVPDRSSRFRGDFMLDSQGDLELIFDDPDGGQQHLSVLALAVSVDDTAWATSRSGALYTTDASADTLDVVYGGLSAGTAYTAVTPCNANSAPATCPAPGFPAPYLGTINLATGAIAKVPLAGAAVQPKGLIFAGF